jgi:2,3-bisphosphoglycerate-dependent phosphoglycerate mutase
MRFLSIFLICSFVWLGLPLRWQHAVDLTDLSGGGLEAASEKIASGGEPTIIYLVRHAEKVTTDPDNQDPDLSPEGYQRAEDLRKRLAGEQLSAAFVTPYQRTRLTVQPLASEKNITLHTYQPHVYQALVDTIRQHCVGQTVVVVGHSNSVLEIIEAFGAKRPLKTLTDQDYDYLFRIVLPRRGKPSVKAEQYGAQARTVQR